MRSFCLLQATTPGGSLPGPWLVTVFSQQLTSFGLALCPQTRLGKHRFAIRVSPEHNDDMEVMDTVASLKTNMLGTSYVLDVLWVSEAMS